MSRLKEVVGFPDCFVTEDGKVASAFGQGRVLKLYTDPDGYLGVGLYNRESKTQTTFRVHRLVAQAFIPNPKNLPIVMHLDDDKTNNHVNNLQWATQDENMKDKVRKGRQARGSSQGRSKLTEDQVLVIKRLLKAGKHTQREIGNMFGVTKENIGHIHNGNTWSHIKLPQEGDIV